MPHIFLEINNIAFKFVNSNNNTNRNLNNSILLWEIFPPSKESVKRFN